MKIDPKSFAPLQKDEIPDLRKIAQAANENTGIALDRTLNVLERTLNERDSQMQANIRLLGENGKLRGLIKNAHDLLSEMNCEFMYDPEDARPRYVWCPTCEAGTKYPDVPVHKSNCLYVHVMDDLKKELGYPPREEDAE